MNKAQQTSSEVTENIQAMAVSETAAQKLEWIEIETDGVLSHEADELVARLGDGWRMPTVAEQLSCIDRTRHYPACDPEKFPGIKPRTYWTSEKTSWDDSARWVVGFDYGNVNAYYDNYFACVRACRASQ